MAENTPYENTTKWPLHCDNGLAALQYGDTLVTARATVSTAPIGTTTNVAKDKSVVLQGISFLFPGKFLVCVDSSGNVYNLPEVDMTAPSNRLM